jgi:hypothetical protein
MSSRPLLIAGVIGGALAVVVLFALAVTVVAVDGRQLTAPELTGVVLGAALGWALAAAVLSVSLDRLRALDRGSDEGGDGGSGRRLPEPPPTPPRPPSAEGDWWPEFERELRAHLQEQDREPALR